MLPLTHEIWKTLTGGYRQPYDASRALLALEATDDPLQEAAIMDELWEELHHQGDVGTASYLAIPQLLRIAKAKGRVDWNTFGLISTIEQQRHEAGNPELPVVYLAEYKNALGELPAIISLLKDDQWDDTTTAVVLSALAISKGHLQLGKIIGEFEDAAMITAFEEFLEQY